MTGRGRQRRQEPSIGEDRAHWPRWARFGDGPGHKGCLSLSPLEVTHSLMEGSLSSNVDLDPHE